MQLRGPGVAPDSALIPSSLCILHVLHTFSQPPSHCLLLMETIIYLWIFSVEKKRLSLLLFKHANQQDDGYHGHLKTVHNFNVVTHHASR